MDTLCCEQHRILNTQYEQSVLCDALFIHSGVRWTWTCYAPVSMSCCQAVGVHVSLRRCGDAIAVHGSHHGVGPPLQQQTHYFKVTCAGREKLRVDEHNHYSVCAPLCVFLLPPPQDECAYEVIAQPGVPLTVRCFYRQPAGVVSSLRCS